MRPAPAPTACSGLVNLFSGGALLQLSIFALGVMPYITATIIIQLLRVVIPHFETLHQEGQASQTKLRSTRYLTIALAAAVQHRGDVARAVSCSARTTSGPAAPAHQRRVVGQALIIIAMTAAPA